MSTPGGRKDVYVYTALCILLVLAALFATANRQDRAQQLKAANAAKLASESPQAQYTQRFNFTDFSLKGYFTGALNADGEVMQSTSTTALGDCQLKVDKYVSSPFTLEANERIVIPWNSLVDISGSHFNISTYANWVISTSRVCSQNGKDLHTTDYFDRRDLDPNSDGKNWLQVLQLGKAK